jgi:hypothetical protein
MLQYQTFIDQLPPKGERAYPTQAQLTFYADYLPSGLLELWKSHGFGFYGDDGFQLIDPDVYRDNLWGWLLRDDGDMDRLPIAITAFGEVLYYRSLSDEGDEDVCILNPHTSEGWVLIWSADDFFNYWCCDRGNYEEVTNLNLFKEAEQRFGALKPNEMFYFTPALRLGGVEKLEHISKGNALVHLDLLLQMALGGN